MSKPTIPGDSGKTKNKKAPASVLLNAGIVTSASRALSVVKERMNKNEPMPREIAEAASALIAAAASWPQPAAN